MENIDYELLREQKDVLFEVFEHDLSVKQLEAIEGLLILIDHLQDEAVKDGMSEVEVFGKDGN